MTYLDKIKLEIKPLIDDVYINSKFTLLGKVIFGTLISPLLLIIIILTAIYYALFTK